MMKRTTLVAICLLIAFFAAKAGAQDEAAGWQIGGSVVTSQLERDNGLIDNNSFGFKLHAQYRFNSWLGLEGTFYNSGNFSTDASQPGESVDILYQGALLQGIVFIPLPVDKLDLFVKGGYFKFDLSQQIGGQNSGTGSDNGAVIGTGLSLGITDSFSFRTELDWYDVAQANLWTINLGVEYHF